MMKKLTIYLLFIIMCSNSICGAEAPPIIRNIDINVTSSSVTVNWLTDKPAITKVEIGIKKGDFYDYVTENDFYRKHTIRIDGVNSDTLYYLRLLSEDRSGNFAYSQVYNFRTSVKNMPPNVESIVFDVHTSSITINWITNEAATSMVELGTNWENVSTYREEGYKTVHILQVANLYQSTQYFVKILSVDEEGDSSIRFYTFKTLSSIIFKEVFQLASYFKNKSIH
jgi:hypothetical protein